MKNLISVSLLVFSTAAIAQPKPTADTVSDVIDACNRHYSPGETLNACFRARGADVVDACNRHYSPGDTLNHCFGALSGDVVDECNRHYSPGDTLNACFSAGSGCQR